MSDLRPQDKSLMPATKAGKRLLEWASMYMPITVAAWIVRSGRMPDGACPECGPLQEAASFLPLREIQRLRAIEEWARHLVALGNRPGLDDDEWEAVFTELEEALGDR